jgi:hypothetical protein
MTIFKSVLLLVCIALTGCESTTFDSMPAGASDACPVNWPGGWIAIDDQGHDDPGFAVFVSPQCAIENVSVTEKSPAPAALKPMFWHNAGHEYALLGVIDSYSLMAEKRDADSVPAPGYFMLRWEIENQQMALRAPAHKRVATLIVNGAIDGSVERKKDRSLHNVINANPEQLRTLLQAIDLYDDSIPSRLRWTGLVRKTLDTTLIKLRKQKIEAEKRH